MPEFHAPVRQTYPMTVRQENNALVELSPELQ
jgi:hypothetical protein